MVVETQEVTQPKFSFMSLVTNVGKPEKSSRSRTVDPLTLAKQKILAGIENQKKYLAEVEAGKPLPTTEGGKTVSVWFRKKNGGYSTTIRYGQASIPFGATKDDTELDIGTAEQLIAFYDAVSEAIGKGELDEKIATMQLAKSASLKGK
jgi:hypothetical protein